MKKLSVMALLVFSLFIPLKAYAYDLNIKFDSYGSYQDDIDKDGTLDTVWIVPVGGSYRVNKATNSVDLNSFNLMYEMIDTLPEPIYIKGKPISIQYIDIGTKKGLEWYGAAKTFLGSGTYEGPDTEYFFDCTSIVYFDTGSDSESMTFSDVAAGMFSGKYPMTDPVPKEYYCLSAVKKGSADSYKSWFFKVLPYEYAIPSKNQVTICHQEKEFQTYQLKGYNYFRLRDLAAAFQETPYAFAVDWNELGVNIMTGEKSKDNISTKDLGNAAVKAVHSNGGILTMGDEVKSVECYSIKDSNYYKLRDIADLLGFQVNYNSATGIIECQ